MQVKKNEVSIAHAHKKSTQLCATRNSKFGARLGYGIRLCLKKKLKTNKQENLHIKNNDIICVCVCVFKQNSNDLINSKVTDYFFPMTNSPWHNLGFVDAKHTPLTSKGIGTVYSRSRMSGQCLRRHLGHPRLCSNMEGVS